MTHTLSYYVLPMTLIIALSGCGRKPSVDDDSSADVREERAGRIAVDKDAQKHIEMLAKANNMEASFDAKGGVTLKDKDSGATVTQDANGDVLTVTGANGSVTKIGGPLPENEFTKKVPAPPFTPEFTASEDNQFTANFSGVTPEQAKAYREKLKEAGYDQDAQVVDQAVEDVTILSYQAGHSNGYHVKFVFTGDSLVLSISR